MDLGVDLEEVYENLREQFPILGSIEGAILQEETPETFANGLSQGGLIAVQTLCAATAVIIGKLASAKLTPVGGAMLSGFLSGLCTYLGKVIPVDAPPPPQPDQPGQPSSPPSCPAGTTYFQEYNVCGSEQAYRPCDEGLGFIDLTGECIRCVIGTSFDPSSRTCTAGCPPGFDLVPEYGCVPPQFGKRCGLSDGSKGIVVPPNACALDPCPQGQIWDFVRNACVSEGTEQKPTPIERKTEEGEGASGWSTGAKFGVAALVLGLVGGGIFFFGNKEEEEKNELFRRIAERRFDLELDEPNLFVQQVLPQPDERELQRRRGNVAPQPRRDEDGQLSRGLRLGMEEHHGPGILGEEAVVARGEVDLEGTDLGDLLGEDERSKPLPIDGLGANIGTKPPSLRIRATTKDNDGPICDGREDAKNIVSKNQNHMNLCG